MGRSCSTHQEAAWLLPAHAGRHHHPIEEYRYVHAARKVVGVGSVGTRCYIMLLLGARQRRPVVSADQGGSGVGSRTLPRQERLPASRRTRSGRPAPDAGRERHFPGLAAYQRARRRNPRLLRTAIPGLEGQRRRRQPLVPGANLYSRICGATLARAHARWGDRIAIASYLGKGDAFDRAIADFAAAYADQNERDYITFTAAVHSGRLVAQTGL